MEEWYSDELGDEWMACRSAAMRILQEESSLKEIVQLVGMDALGPNDRLTMETAKAIREDYLHQNAFHEVDTYSSLKKQLLMMRLILEFDALGRDQLDKNVDIEDIIELPIREKIGRAKYIPEDRIAEFDDIFKEMKKEMLALSNEGEI